VEDTGEQALARVIDQLQANRHTGGAPFYAERAAAADDARDERCGLRHAPCASLRVASEAPQLGEVL